MGLGLAACLSFAFVDADKPLTVVIDAGHGGKDHGATASGITEKQIVEAIAARIAQANHDDDLRLYFTRNDDSFVDLQDRSKLARDVKADIVVSLHVNTAKDGDRSGLLLFVPDNRHRDASQRYAEDLSEHIKAKGYFTESRISPAPMHILKHSDAPAVIAELGYITNEADRAYITSSKGQTEIAEAVLDALQTH